MSDPPRPRPKTRHGTGPGRNPPSDDERELMFQVFRTSKGSEREVSRQLGHSRKTVHKHRLLDDWDRRIVGIRQDAEVRIDRQAARDLERSAQLLRALIAASMDTLLQKGPGKPRLAKGVRATLTDLDRMIRTLAQLSMPVEERIKDAVWAAVERVTLRFVRAVNDVIADATVAEKLRNAILVGGGEEFPPGHSRNLGEEPGEPTVQ